MKVPILIGFAYLFNLKTKANPSPKENGFVFTLIGDPYVESLRFAIMPGWLTCHWQLRSKDSPPVRFPTLTKTKTHQSGVFFFLVTPTGIEPMLPP